MKKLVNNLVKLQEFDTRLRELKLQKGDLPSMIENLSGNLSEKRSATADYKEKVDKLRSDRKMFTAESDAGKAQLKKYEEQLYKVQNNKEYDAISLEIDTKKAEIENLQNKILQTMEEEESLQSNNVEIVDEMKSLEEQLKEAEGELEEIDKLTREEETRLTGEREKVAGRLDKRQLRQYERISNAKAGIAVASIQRDSCGGCFSSIPPQRIVEIRGGERLINCEHCGRILVWQDEVTEVMAG
ncbi:MAG: zinc ribbon domain-containing protein [Calditrichia bacterium]